MKKMVRKQGSNPDNYAFYQHTTKDEAIRSYRTTFTLKSKNESSTTDLAPNPENEENRLYIIKSNDLQYFYEEKEESDRVYLYH